MTIETVFTKAIGIRIPVVQGGMQWVGLPKLVAGVSNAGGLGVLTALTQPSPEKLREAIRETRKLTDKPFGVNITFLPSISPPPYMEYAKVVIEEGIKVVETAGGPAAKPVIEEYKKHGIYVIHKCTSIRHALSAQKLGADCLSIDGFECAGHPGEDDIGGLVLLARAAQELKVPYLASGGIANGRGLAAALALGASGVNMGSAFMVTDECEIHDNIKDVIVASDERDTVHMFRTMKNTARVYKNAVSKKVVEIENRPGGAKFEDIRDLVSGQRGRRVYIDGDKDAGVWSAGISIGLLKRRLSCAEFLREIEQDAEEILKKNVTLIKPSPSSSSLSSSTRESRL